MDASLSPDWLPIAVRAYTAPTKAQPDPEAGPETTPTGTASSRRSAVSITPEFVLVLDTETTVDASQRLLFGSWRTYQHGRCRDEGLFYGDDLPAADRALLEAYAQTHPADIDTETAHPQPLPVLSRRAFLKDVFWKVAYKGRGLVVGFNLPFDLARLGIGWGMARGGYYAGGFSLPLASYDKDGQIHENRYRPRIAVKSLDSKRALMGFTRSHAPDPTDVIPEGARDGQPDPSYTFPGYLLDLRAAAFALTNASHSLASACVAFGVEHAKQQTRQHGVVTADYLDYNRRDVLASWELSQQLQAELDRHPIALPLWRAYSPASIGKAYLAAMGIRPIVERQPTFPQEVLGSAMVAYYGGRAECRIRGVPVPVVYLDFLSMYPTVCSLLNLWQLLTCEQLEVVDATEDVQLLLAGITLERCCDPQLWRQCVGLVQLLPEGDILPTRAHYGGEAAWQIGVNPLTAREPLWYTIPDAVAATLLSGKVPQIVRALRLVPQGQAEGLRPVRLRGQVLVDPATQDFFRVVIEERHRLKTRTDRSAEERARLDAFLKVLANATGYGIYAEMNAQDLPKGQTQQVDVYGTHAFRASVRSPEEPGTYCFPPLAACIAGAARLMLGLLERSITEAGGTYALCDTDSMAVVATEDGGLLPCPGGAEQLPDGRAAVRALSWAEVETIRQRFAALSPYDRAAVPGSVLKLEDENLDPQTGQQQQLWAYPLSAKRYALFNVDEGDGRPILRKSSEHGLGHLLSPTDPPNTEEFDEEDNDRTAWMGTLWEGLITEALGQPFTWPDWLDRPALGRITASSPEMLHPFATWNAGKPYAQQVKPYNFLLTAFVRHLGHPEGVDPKRFHLVAPFETDPRKWRSLAWRNLYDTTGTRYTIRAESSPYAVPGEVQVKTYRDVLDEYRRHPETKSLAPDGAVCSGTTVGLLRRRPVTAAYVTHVGKESNRLEEVNTGLVHDPEEVYTAYEDPQHEPWQTVVVPVLRRMPRAVLAEQVGLSERTIAAVRNGHALPRAVHQEALTRAAGGYARARLRAAGNPVRVRLGDLEACAAYLAAYLVPVQ
jgi:hypothetical protein